MYGFNSALFTPPANLCSDLVVLPLNTSKQESSATGDLEKCGKAHLRTDGETAHFTRESYQQVKDVISFLKPQVAFLELCLQRYDTLEHHEDSIRLTHCEFCAAIDEVKKYDAKVIPGDRCIDITIGRASPNMSLWKQILIHVLLPYPVFIPIVSQMLLNNAPVVMGDERDQYMAATLFKVASEYNSVVAVMGMGHLSGIQKYWKQPIDVKPLLVIPENEMHTYWIRFA